MTTSNYQYWPFAVVSAEGLAPQGCDQVAFLRATHAQGYESFRFGMNDYGAKSSEREGCILERGRNRWEIRLALGEERRLVAYVNEFSAAAEAVTQWLQGACAKDILHSIAERLETPPGAKADHCLFEEDPPS